LKIETVGTRIKLRQACKQLQGKFAARDLESRMGQAKTKENTVSHMKDNLIQILKEESSGDFLLRHSDLEFTKELGNGTSSKVYKGLLKGTKVAIKVLKQIDNSAVQEFRKELQVMTILNSDYVVQFFGACLEPRICMVMEYCNRKSLNHVMQDKRYDIGWERGLYFALSTAKGLQYLHSRSILHRDMKSLNLLVHEDHGNWALKVSDFGLARLNNSKNQNTLTKICGTYAYLSPEVCSGERFTEKSDIFSMAVIFWEIFTRIITGAYVYPYSEYIDIQLDIQIAVAVSEKGVRPTLPEEIPKILGNLVHACFQAKPMDRPSVDSIIKQLTNAEEEYKQNNWKEAISRISQ